MLKGQTLQDPFLNALRKDRIPVSIFLVNGIKLQGQIESFDQYAVLLKNTVSQMVYKHAISTIVPTRNPRADGVPTAGGFPASNAGTGYPMGGGLGSGFDRSTPAGLNSGFGMGGTRPQGGFTRTPPYERQGGFERGAFDKGYQNQGFEQGGFRQGGFGGGFDRSSYEERGFDGKTFDGNTNHNKGLDLGGFDKFGSDDNNEQ